MTSISNGNTTGANAPTIRADSPTGSYCQCTDGSYQLDFNLTSNAISINTTLLHYDNEFTTNCTGTNANSMSNEQRDACFNYRDNSEIICGAFGFAFQGQMALNLANGSLSGNIKRPAVLKRVFNTSLDVSENQVDGRYFIQPAALPGTDDLTEYLPGMFSNLTASLIPDFNVTFITSAFVKESGQRWVYKGMTLVYVYVPSLALVLGVMAYALYCIRQNGSRVMESDFSTLLTTTRNDEMDRVYDSAKDFGDLLTMRIVFTKEGAFRAAKGDGEAGAGADEIVNGTSNGNGNGNGTSSGGNGRKDQPDHLVSPTEYKSPTGYRSSFSDFKSSSSPNQTPTPTPGPTELQYQFGPNSPGLSPNQYAARP
jgi:hypothetical protein